MHSFMDSQKTLQEIHGDFSNIDSLRTKANQLRKLSQDNHVKRMLLARRRGEPLNAIFILPSNHPSSSKKIPKYAESECLDEHKYRSADYKTRTAFSCTFEDCKNAHTDKATELLKKQTENAENAEFPLFLPSPYLKKSHKSKRPSKKADVVAESSPEDNSKQAAQNIISAKNIREKLSKVKSPTNNSDSKSNARGVQENLLKNVNKIPIDSKTKAENSTSKVSGIPRPCPRARVSNAEEDSQMQSANSNVNNNGDVVSNSLQGFRFEGELRPSAKAATQTQKKSLAIHKMIEEEIQKLAKQDFTVPPTKTAKDSKKEDKKKRGGTSKKKLLYSEKKHEKKSTWTPMPLKLNSTPSGGHLMKGEGGPKMSLDSGEGYDMELPSANIDEPYASNKIHKHGYNTPDRATGNQFKSSFTCKNKRKSINTKNQNCTHKTPSKIPLLSSRVMKDGNMAQDDPSPKSCEIIVDESTVSLPDLNISGSSKKPNAILPDNLPHSDCNTNVSFWLENLIDTNEASVTDSETNTHESNDFWKDVVNEPPLEGTDDGGVAAQFDHNQDQNKACLTKNKTNLGNCAKANCRERVHDSTKIANSRISVPNDKQHISDFSSLLESAEKNWKVSDDTIGKTDNISDVLKLERDARFSQSEDGFPEKSTTEGLEGMICGKNHSESEEISAETIGEVKKNKMAKRKKSVKNKKDRS